MNGQSSNSRRSTHIQDTPEGEGALDAGFLLEFYKALSEPVRLRIAGMLAERPATTAQVARALGLPAPAAARHIARLRSVGLVVPAAGGAYALDAARLRRRAAQTLESPRVNELAGATDERSRVLAAFFREGRLLSFPSGDQRKLVVLTEIAAQFERDRTYMEREVNAVLAQVYDDYTTIRRALVDYHFMNRHSGVYWLGEGRPGALATDGGPA